MAELLQYEPSPQRKARVVSGEVWDCSQVERVSFVQPKPRAGNLCSMDLRTICRVSHSLFKLQATGKPR